MTSAIALAGCDLLAPEEIALTRLTVPRCVTTFPRFPTAEFFSYRNENSDTWISPARNLPNSTFTFNATPRVTLAWSGPSRWNVLHTTVQELRQVECSTPDVSNVTHPTFNGSVQNWRADEQLAISLGNWYTYSNPNLNPNFTPTFTATPQLSPFDVLAYATSASSQRIIARRGLTPPAGSTIPPLDFASSEPKSMTSMSVSIPALLSNESGGVASGFLSAFGSQLHLGSVSVSAGAVALTSPGFRPHWKCPGTSIRSCSM